MISLLRAPCVSNPLPGTLYPPAEPPAANRTDLAPWPHWIGWKSIWTLGHKLQLTSSTSLLVSDRHLLFLQILTDATHKGPLSEGVMEHPDDAGRTLITDDIKDVHNIRLGLHIVRHGTHIKEGAVGESKIRFFPNEHIHHMLIRIELKRKREII